MIFSGDVFVVALSGDVSKRSLEIPTHRDSKVVVSDEVGESAMSQTF